MFPDYRDWTDFERFQQKEAFEDIWRENSEQGQSATMQIVDGHHTDSIRDNTARDKHCHQSVETNLSVYRSLIQYSS